MIERVVIGDATLYLGSCEDVLAELSGIDACVTDPPYGLGFMGKGWDRGVPPAAIWQAVLAAIKPGAHLLSFGGTRTYHRMAAAIEDAGFDLRDMIAWVYGSGFPKSLDVSKAIDKAAGAERQVVGTKVGIPGYSLNQCASPGGVAMEGNIDGSLRNPEAECAITAPATEDARQWQGWGTALKPALEPITVARKPLVGTVAGNVLQHGTGAINVDGCRVGETVETWPASRSYAPGQMQPGHRGQTQTTGTPPAGRWPANLIHDGSDEVLQAFPQAPGQSGAVTGREPSSKTRNTFGLYNERPEAKPRSDTGSAARFFYCAKASKADRGEGNVHPTVKPTDLMRYLCRLVTPPGGIVLDPFMGSGSTGKAALLEGFRFIGIEREREYFDIACARIEAAQRKRDEFQRQAAELAARPVQEVFTWE